MIVDPPGGWRYGFPKKMPDNIDTKEEFEEWLTEQGYPDWLLDDAWSNSRYLSGEDENMHFGYRDERS